MRVDFIQILATLALLVLVLKSVRENKFTKMIKSEHIMMLILSLFVLNPLMRKNDAVEFYDGSQTAFDKEAFINLNRVVSELAGSGNLTIPGNLTVSGDLHMGTSKIPSISKDNYAIVKKLKVGSVPDPGDGEITAKTGFFGTGQPPKDGQPFRDTRMRITDRKIGNKTAGDISFDDDKWKRCKKYDNDAYELHGVAGADSWVTGSSTVVGNLGVGGRATTKDLTVTNNANITNNITAKDLTVNNSANIGQNLRVNGQLDIDSIKGHAYGGNNIRMHSGFAFKSNDGTKVRLAENGNHKFNKLNHDSGDGEIGRADGQIYIQGDDIVRIKARGKETAEFNNGKLTLPRGLHISGHNETRDFLTVTGYGADHIDENKNNKQNQKYTWRAEGKHGYLAPFEFSKNDGNWVDNQIETHTRGSDVFNTEGITKLERY